MAQPPFTATRQLADLKLNGTLDKFVTERRAKARSWRLISRDLYEATGLDITYETLRSWYPELRDNKAAS